MTCFAMQRVEFAMRCATVTTLADTKGVVSLVLPNCTSEAAREVAERVRQQICAEPMVNRDRDYRKYWRSPMAFRPRDQRTSPPG